MIAFWRSAAATITEGACGSINAAVSTRSRGTFTSRRYIPAMSEEDKKQRRRDLAKGLDEADRL